MISQEIRCRTFIGRRAQLDLLLRARAASAAESGKMVLIAGDAGSGKSRLVTQFFDGISPSEMPRAVGHCLEYAQSPFAPIVEALRGVLDERGAPRLSQEVREPLAWLLPELRVSNERVIERDKLQLLNAMAEALQEVSSKNSATVVIEDLHWADAATLEFLQHVLHSLAKSRLLLLVTYRSEEVHHGHPLSSILARLERHPSVLSIELEPLSSSEMNALIYHSLEGRATLPSEVVGAISSQAEGNPLFAEELLRNATQNASALRAPLLPRTLREAVLERLKVLGNDERELLAEAAVMGRRFRAEFLAAATGTPIERTLSVLRAARDLQLIVEEVNGVNYFTFRHALTREAIYGELLAAEARVLHRRNAIALEAPEASDESTAELAYHWWKAREPDKAVKYNELAGDRAFRVYAYQDCLINYERALEMDAQGGAHRASLQRKLAKALHQCGLGMRASLALDAALEYYLSAGDLENAAWTCLSLGRIRSTLAHIAGQAQMNERAVTLVGQNALSPALFAARVAMANVYTSFHCDSAKALNYLDKAQEQLANARSRDQVRFFETRSMVRILQGRPQEGLDDARRATEIAGTTGDVHSAIRLWGNVAVTLTDCGEGALALHAFKEAADIVRDKRFGGVTGNWVMVEFAFARLLHGELEQARELVELGLAANIESLRFRVLLARTGILVGLMLENSELVQRAAKPELIELAIGAGELKMVEISAALAEYYQSVGNVEAAASLLHRQIEACETLDLHPPPGSTDWLLATAKYGDAADIPRARMFLARAAESTKVRAMPACVALFDACAASRAGLQADTLANGARAALLFHDIEWPYHEAQASELADKPKDALEIYKRIGDVRDARRLEAALNPPNRRGRSKNALTSREREISDLVGNGMSNRVIADTLVISERTVESHVSAILNKLNLASRAELIAHLKQN